MRDVKKQANIGKGIIQSNYHYDLCIDEMKQIYEGAKSQSNHPGFIHAIITSAFYMGVAAGKRIGEKTAAEHQRKTGGAAHGRLHNGTMES